MKIKTVELIGDALNWAVAQCEKQTTSKTTGEPFLYEHRLYLQDFDPSGNWSQGGPIIEREKIATGFDDAHWLWVGTIYGDDTKPDVFQYGPTPLVAAMRCFVASKLGEEVEIPDELTKEK